MNLAVGRLGGVGFLLAKSSNTVPKNLEMVKDNPVRVFNAPLFQPSGESVNERQTQTFCQSPLHLGAMTSPLSVTIALAISSTRRDDTTCEIACALFSVILNTHFIGPTAIPKHGSDR